MNNKAKIGNRDVTFKYPIDKILEINNSYVVLLEVPVKILFNENIYGVSNSGKIIWQIDKTRHVYEKSPYTNIFIEKGKIWAFNWDGMAHELNEKTGKIISEKYLK